MRRDGSVHETRFELTTLQDVDRRVTVIEAGLENLATKDDLTVLETRLSRLETRMESTATKADLAELDSRMSRLETRIESSATKADLAELETRLVKWMVGVLIGATVGASSIAVLVQSLIS